MRMNETTRFEDAARIWLSVKQLEVKANTYSESYERTVEKILLPRMEDITLGEIDREFTSKMFLELSEHYSDSTLHKCQIVIDGIFSEAAYAGAKLTPLPKIKIKSKIPTVFSGIDFSPFILLLGVYFVGRVINSLRILIAG